MQPTHAEPRQPSADFDFGVARAGTTRQKRARPGLTAGLIAFAFTLSMLIPVGAKAEPAWMLFPDQLSAPTSHEGTAGVILTESKRWERPGWDKPYRRALPEVCALQIDGPRGGLSGYSENCLRSRGFDDRLPRRCALHASLFGKRDRVYTEDCLREERFELRYR